MPIYEYVCQSCENRFEVKQGIKDPPLTACQRCGQPVVKVISAPAIMFKGTGWYVTDYSDKMKPSGQSDAGKPSNGKNDSASAEPKTKEAPAGSAAAASTPAPAATPAAPSSTTNSGSGSSTSGSTTPTSSSSGSGS